jgi:hypothetical protein
VFQFNQIGITMRMNRGKLLFGSSELIDLYIQQSLLDVYFPFIKTSIKDRNLYCYFIAKDLDWKQDYKISILYNSNYEPYAFVNELSIQPNSSIHMYNDRSLCLFNPIEYPMNKRFTLAFEIVPWVYKWIYFYELWKVNGNIWLAPESPHFLSRRLRN